MVQSESMCKFTDKVTSGVLKECMRSAKNPNCLGCSYLLLLQLEVMKQVVSKISFLSRLLNYFLKYDFNYYYYDDDGVTLHIYICVKRIWYIYYLKRLVPTAVLLHCPFQFWAWVHVSALSLLMYVPIWLVGGPIANSTNNYAFFSNFILGNYPWKHPFQEKKIGWN